MKMKKLTQKQVLDNLGKIFYTKQEIESVEREEEIKLPSELKAQLYDYECSLHSNNFRDKEHIENFIIKIKATIKEIDAEIDNCYN